MTQIQDSVGGQSFQSINSKCVKEMSLCWMEQWSFMELCIRLQQFKFDESSKYLPKLVFLNNILALN